MSLSRVCAQPAPVPDPTAPDASRDREARGLFEAGEEAFRAGRYADALDYFRRAHTLSGRAALLYNVGVAADRVRRDDEAIEAFERYLRESPATVSNRTEVESRLHALREVRAQRVGTGTPVPAVTAAVAVTTPVATPSVVPAVAPAVSVAAPEAPHGAPLARAEEHRGGGRLFTWVALGAGVAAGVGGAVVAGLASSDYDGLVQGCAAKGGCAQAEIDDANLSTRATLANVLFVVGGAALAAGVVLFFVEGGSGGPEDARVAVGVGPGGLVARGSF